MTDKNQQHDSFRFGRETADFRTQEATSHLVREAENKAVNALIRAFGNGKVSDRPAEATLERVEGPTSNSLIFSGKIRVHAWVDQNHATHDLSVDLPVAENAVEVPAEDELRAILEQVLSQASEPTIVTEDGVVLGAALEHFAVQDDGSDYLTVSHPAFEDTVIGIVHKNEYNAVSDKEAFLKGLALDRFARSGLENHFTLTFTGSFAEPTITRKEADKKYICDKCGDSDTIPDASSSTAVDRGEYLCDACSSKTAAQEPITPAVEIESGDLLLGQSADAYRQLTEAEALRLATHKEKVVSAAVNGLIAHLTSLNYGSPKAGTIESTLEYGENGYTGQICISASVEASDGLKVVTIPVTVEADKVAFPKKTTIADLITKAVDVRSKLEEEFAKEVLANMEQIDAAESWKEAETTAALEDAKIEKTAADLGGTQYLGPMDTMKLSKHFLASAPELEIGDVIFADGHHWKLIDKSSEQLSKGEDDASLWTFAKVAPSDKEPKENVGR